MVAYTPIVPSTTLGEVLRPIRDMSDADFQVLLSEVSGPRSFSLPTDQIKELRDKLPAHASQLTFLLAALKYVHAHLARNVDAGMSWPDAVSALVRELDKDAEWGSEGERTELRLHSLFTQESHKRYEKLKRLQTGFVPNAVAFSTLVDLRPAFGEGDKLSLQGLVPVLQMRITTDSNDPNEKQFVFQVSQVALTELKKAIDRAEKKLAMIKQEPSIALQVFEN